MRMLALFPIIQSASENVRKAFQMGIHVAAGSDAVAYRVYHGQGIQDEDPCPSKRFWDAVIKCIPG